MRSYKVFVDDAVWNAAKLSEHVAAVCDCGKRFVPLKSNVYHRLTRSCGCMRGGPSHGMSYSPEYKIWNSMRDRCRNPNNPSYKNYGGRGIKVHDSWLTFEGFIKSMGARPSPNLELDRINNDGNYEPGNCRWVLREENSANRRQYKTSKGYSISKHKSKWRLRMGVGSSMKHVGVYATLDEVRAIVEAKGIQWKD